MRRTPIVAAITATLATVVALLTGFDSGPAQAASHQKVGPYYLPTGQVTCTYSGLDLTGMSVPAAHVSMDKALYRHGRHHQYVGISLQLQGEHGGTWSRVLQHGGTGRRHVAYSVDTHVRRYAQIPSRKKSGILTFADLQGLTGYSAYRVQVTLMWYALDNRHIRGRVSKVLAAYERGSSCPAHLPAPPVIGHPQFVFPPMSSTAVVPGLNSGSATLAGVSGTTSGTLTLYRANTAVPCTQATPVWSTTVSQGNGAVGLAAPASGATTPGYYTWGFSAPANAANTAVPLTCSGVITGHYTVGKIVISAGDGHDAGYKYALGKDFPVNISFASPSGTVLNDGHAYSVTVGMYQGTSYTDIHCGAGQLVKTHTVLVNNLGGTYTLKFTIDSAANAGKFRFQAVWNDKGGPQASAYVPPSDCKLDRAWG